MQFYKCDICGMVIHNNECIKKVKMMVCEISRLNEIIFDDKLDLCQDCYDNIKSGRISNMFKYIDFGNKDKINDFIKKIRG